MGDVFVYRTIGVAPGGESWVDTGDDLVLLASVDGMTQKAAEGLEEAFRFFIDRGEWQYRQPGGHRQHVTYSVDDLPEDVCVRMHSKRGDVRCIVDRAHVSPASLRGLQAAATTCVDSGWRWYSAAERSGVERQERASA